MKCLHSDQLLLNIRIKNWNNKSDVRAVRSSERMGFSVRLFYVTLYKINSLNLIKDLEKIVITRFN